MKKTTFVLDSNDESMDRLSRMLKDGWQVSTIIPSPELEDRMMLEMRRT